MGGHLIEYKLHPRSAWETWAYRVGTRREAETSALSLRAELREKYPRAQVRVSGKQLRERRASGETEAQ